MQKLRQDKSIGDTLRGLRIQAGLTQEQVAAQLQITAAKPPVMKPGN